jgi:hypothetical protein
MKWEADVRLMGQVGSMGQRVLQPIVNQQVQNVLKSLDAQVSEAVSSSDSTPAAAGSSGAEAGIHPGSPETYASEPRGPTHSANGE